MLLGSTSIELQPSLPSPRQEDRANAKTKSFGRHLRL